MTLKTITSRFDPRARTASRATAVAATPLPAAPVSDLARLRHHAVLRLEESLDHVPTLLRRLGLFLLVGTFAMIAFAVAVVVVLIHAVA
jgi:hypothetical protein